MTSIKPVTVSPVAFKLQNGNFEIVQGNQPGQTTKYSLMRKSDTGKDPHGVEKFNFSQVLRQYDKDGDGKLDSMITASTNADGSKAYYELVFQTGQKDPKNNGVLIHDLTSDKRPDQLFHE